MVNAVDVWFNAWNPAVANKFANSGEMQYVSKVEKLDDTGVTPYQAVEILDQAGVEMALCPTFKQGSIGRMRRGFTKNRLLLDMTVEDILPFIEGYPDRFRGLYGINPWLGMDGVREMEKMVKDYGFVGANIHAAGFAPINDKIWYPFYTKCCELDIPVIAQIGHYGEPMQQSYGHPLLIDEIALDFPELRFIGGHTGWPWSNVLMAEALKNENVFVSMEAHLPRYWEPSMVKYIDTRGKDKCMWGTDFPVTSPKRSLEQIANLGFRKETLKKFLRNNAIDVFKLDLIKVD